MNQKFQKFEQKLEPMDQFFSSRIDAYEEHMTTAVEELPEAYAELARLVPSSALTILDLGCGTGLELEMIFPLFPYLEVTAIDLTQAMLDKLTKKFADKRITPICANYFEYNFGEAKFDAAISFETMHHLTREEKSGLYANVRKSLKPGGKYIECDYMVDTQGEEDNWLEESRRLRSEQGIPSGALYHYDTPLTINNQIRLLLAAGYIQVKKAWRKNGTAIIVADHQI
jgi:SAM-dependent methyltransferase